MKKRKGSSKIAGTVIAKTLVVASAWLAFLFTGEFVLLDSL